MRLYKLRDSSNQKKELKWKVPRNKQREGMQRSLSTNIIKQRDENHVSSETIPISFCSMQYVTTM